MTNTNLTDFDIDTILSVFKSFPKIDEAILFGSRAKGTSKQGSDIDIALKGISLHDDIARISATLNEETPLPYFFDILDYQTITNIELKNHIDRIGLSLYKKTDTP